MADQDSTIKIALICALVLFLAFGALGFYFVSKIGTEADQKECLEKKRLALEKERIDKEIDIDGDRIVVERYRHLETSIDTARKEEGLYAKIFAKEVETREVEWQRKQVKSNASRLAWTQKSLERHKEMRTSALDALVSVRQDVAEIIEKGDDSDPGDQDRGEGQSISAFRADQNRKDAEFTKQRNDLKTKREDLQRDIRKDKLDYTRRYKDRVDTRSKLETEYHQIRDELQRYMVREPPGIDKSYDSVVLKVDINSGQVLIDIGERDGVRRGMRFEVFQLREGDRRIHKSYIAVRGLEPEISHCHVFDKEIELPSCPGCGYAARYPEERFCPYCSGSGGVAGTKHQRLSGYRKQATLGMDPDEPIVEGDLVQNPLFVPGRQLHVAVEGDLQNPIHDDFPMGVFIDAVRRHGGIVDEEVGAQTDMLVAGKFAQQDVRRAREFGIRVVHQCELFHFLRR